MDIEHETDRNRYVGRIDGQIVCVLDYPDNGTVVSMTRTFTNPPYRGRGLAAEIVEHAVDDVERAGRTVRPMCWYVADWFEAHPERAALLA
ncbi:MAG: GNAT family N-acetyltransferase [Amnibacterium sp.]